MHSRRRRSSGRVRIFIFIVHFIAMMLIQISDRDYGPEEELGSGQGQGRKIETVKTVQTVLARASVFYDYCLRALANGERFKKSSVLVLRPEALCCI